MKSPPTPPAQAGVPDRADPPAAARDAVRAMYEAHAGFVYQSLARLGVRGADLPDVTHEVFLVAFRRAGAREGRSSDRTWLFGIAFKLAAAYRRRAFRKREKLVEDPGTDVAAGSERAERLGAPTTGSPEDHAARNEARVAAEAILHTLPLEERVAFVMFEVDGVSCPEIAEELGWPLGTVYTRVRNARKRFEAAVRRHRAREDHRLEKGALAVVVGGESSGEPTRLLDDPNASSEVTSALSRLPSSPVLPAATKAAIGAKLAGSLAAAGTVAGGAGLAGFVAGALPSGGAALVTLAVAGASALALLLAARGNSGPTSSLAPAPSHTARQVPAETSALGTVEADDAPLPSTVETTSVPARDRPSALRPHGGPNPPGRARTPPGRPPRSSPPVKSLPTGDRSAARAPASAPARRAPPADPPRDETLPEPITWERLVEGFLDAPEASATDSPATDPPAAEGTDRRERGDRGDPVPDTDALSAEQALLVAARAAAADDPEESLALLETHAERFPAGQMASDRDLLTILVLGRLGRVTAQQNGIRAFLERYPSSPFAPALRRQLPARAP